jgi:hypothetical protein
VSEALDRKLRSTAIRACHWSPCLPCKTWGRWLAAVGPQRHRWPVRFANRFGWIAIKARASVLDYCSAFRHCSKSLFDPPVSVGRIIYLTTSSNYNLGHARQISQKILRASTASTIPSADNVTNTAFDVIHDSTRRLLLALPVLYSSMILISEG